MLYLGALTITFTAYLIGCGIRANLNSSVLTTTHQYFTSISSLCRVAGGIPLGYGTDLWLWVSHTILAMAN